MIVSKTVLIYNTSEFSPWNTWVAFTGSLLNFCFTKSARDFTLGNGKLIELLIKGDAKMSNFRL